MEHVSRRAFVTQASIGVAAVGAIAATGLNLAPGAQAEATPRAELGQPLVARVRDLDSGQVDLFVGEREVTVTDHDLANRLARAFTTA